jgi:prepilin-type N-terminal cleavage/methylation domain-containing protein
MKERMKNKKGFTIAEVLVASFILSIGVTAVLSLMSGSIKASIDSRNVIIASELAQEEVELIRNIRDNNWAKNSDSFASPFPASSTCAIDPSYSYPNTVNCGTGINLKLYSRNSGNFAYTHSSSGNTETIFSRKASINFLDESGNAASPADSEARAIIKSYVIWNGTDDWEFLTSGGDAKCTIANKCVEIEDILTKWNE